MVDPPPPATATNSAVVRVKNKNAAPVQVSAEQLVGEASALNDTLSGGSSSSRSGGGSGESANAIASASAEGTRKTATSASPGGADNDGPSPKRQRTDGDAKKTSDDTKPAARDAPNAATSSAAEAVASKCQTATLFVGNLHPRIGDAHLTKLFSPYGTLNRISLVKNGASGQPKGYAFVEFNSVESARMAIRRVDGRVLLHRALAVRPANEKAGPAANDDDRNSSGIVVKDKRQVRKEKSEVLSKIEAVKRAIEEKKARAAAGKSFDRSR
mmetsp:Transcript_18543/g.53231  ORF Transcript_18543/g.53231 Transcript_18543/m.53231 type:complete len:271 (+) Transcript_18543:208-1020(+)